MKVLLCEEPGRISLTKRQMPTRGKGEVLVRIRYIGVCGTDFHIYAGQHPFLSYPRIMGHELSGIVEEAGPGSAFAPGDAVYIVPYLACGTCQACQKGLTNACMNIEVLGVHRDGGMAEFLCVPETNLHKIGDISLKDAAMIEFLAIGAHGVKRGDIKPQDRVLITGAGPIGMAAMIFAKSRGANVTALDMRADRLNFARDRLNIDHILPKSAKTDSQILDITDGNGFDVVIDATGTVGAMEHGFNFLAHGGRYVFLSVVRQNICFSDPEFHKREATLFASRNAQPDDFAEVVRQIEAGHVPTDALNTHNGHIEDGPDLFVSWAKPETGVIKAIFSI